MSGYINPKWVIAEFFRRRMTDPRTTRTYTENSTTLTGSSTYAFRISPSSGKSLSYVTTVTVGGIAATKWLDYWIDYQNQRVIFFTARMGEVIINFYESSTDWVFPDKPLKKLEDTSFPRIQITSTPAGGDRLGKYDAPVLSTMRITVHIWAKEKANNQIFTISQGDPYGDVVLSGESLAEYLGFQILKIITDNASDMHPILTDIQPMGPPADLPYNDELQCHHKTVEFLITGINLGEIE